MEYKPTVYIRNESNSCRYALGQLGERNLYVIGLNPSTASDAHPDQTLSKVLGFASRNGYDGFLMLNLYPQRTPFPERLHKRAKRSLTEENQRYILQQMDGESQPHILAAWGMNITIRNYLLGNLQALDNALSPLVPQWLKIGSLTQKGHPRHPSRCSYQHALTALNMKTYLHELKP